MKNLRIAFFGTPALTTTILDELKNNGLLPIVIISGVDVPIGRKQVITPPPAKVWALTNNIEVLQPLKLDEIFLDEFRKMNIDLSVAVAYGKIMPEILINTPRLGTINIHYSLLPKYRGATPVEAVILAGEKITGVSIQHMRYKLDSGPIILSSETSITETETAKELRSRLNETAKKLLIEAIDQLTKKTAIFKEQNETQATFCKKINKENGLVDITGDPIENYRKFRAYYGWPGIYFFTNTEKKTRVIIKDAKLINDIFVIKRVLPEGKKEMPYETFLKSNL